MQFCGLSVLHVACGFVKTLSHSYKNAHFRMMHWLWWQKLMGEIDNDVDDDNANDVDDNNV